MSVKTPEFDKPVGLGATGEKRTVNPDTAPVEVGTRVMLIYQGKNMTADVTTVEEPRSQYIGRVLGFETNQVEHGELRHGDLFRFRHSDLRWIG